MERFVDHVHPWERCVVRFSPLLSMLGSPRLPFAYDPSVAAISFIQRVTEEVCHYSRLFHPHPGR
jgi:hypothetical protein